MFVFPPSCTKNVNYFSKFSKQFRRIQLCFFTNTRIPKFIEKPKSIIQRTEEVLNIIICPKSGAYKMEKKDLGSRNEYSYPKSITINLEVSSVAPDSSMILERATLFINCVCIFLILSLALAVVNMLN